MKTGPLPLVKGHQCNKHIITYVALWTRPDLAQMIVNLDLLEVLNQQNPPSLLFSLSQLRHGSAVMVSGLSNAHTHIVYLCVKTELGSAMMVSRLSNAHTHIVYLCVKTELGSATYDGVQAE